MKSSDKKEASNHLIVENLHAPETFVSNVPNFSIGNGVVTLTLASLRFDNAVTPAEQHVVTVGRMVMPIASARVLATSLHNFLEQHGVHAITEEEKAHMQ